MYPGVHLQAGRSSCDAVHMDCCSKGGCVGSMLHWISRAIVHSGVSKGVSHRHVPIQVLPAVFFWNISHPPSEMQPSKSIASGHVVDGTVCSGCYTVRHRLNASGLSKHLALSCLGSR